MASKTKVREGDWFLVPVGDDRWVVGRIARKTRQTVLAYFFTPARERVPELKEISHLTAADSFLQLRISDQRMVDGRWPVLGHDDFHRDEWPVVELERVLAPSGREPAVYAVLYAEDNLNEQQSARRVPLSERGRRPPEGLHGAGIAESAVRKAIAALEGASLDARPSDVTSATGPDAGAGDARGTLRHYLYVPDRARAEALARDVRGLGHAVETRPAALGDDWLVLVTDRASYSPESADRTETQLTALATRYGGEYDGNEIAL
ncbi:MAG TPA: Imm26 family immunity protein [Actinomycetota bacterium]|nr:Imm26 family immunity protein [Actinomycetota bacterium]